MTISTPIIAQTNPALPALAIAPAVHYLRQPSPLGELIVAATERGICGLYFEQHKYFRGTADWRYTPVQRHLLLAARQLDDYFDGKLTRFTLPLDLAGTPFQRSVWQALSDIPFGATVSYGEHARQIGRPSAVRAVGTAIGRNPVSIVVPCHRVLGSAGSLAGYAGGLERKQFLLTLEGRRSPAGD
ncbi:methylated-DNA--[protein]-cysteine S-methyltransferase [Actimicrobium antarcticum]|uniref:Methylated-DNA--protein-cysteine methyltransferase n=1 Tax=Actimicrobium antarcticum TaxID=1051899 RepID=A0ABP7T639_9BURK